MVDGKEGGKKERKRENENIRNIRPPEGRNWGEEGVVCVHVGNNLG